ncbi:hypothetical protein LT85_2016 [Collimonas arenae]|uniref:Uncharacterized protein n=1 Tax=Collimonas arenae TaxID=279058 RepID=A0A0A1FBX0_9BURK|nr:hypothetical protein LT85_2016 [Collimonas arenae]
MEWMWLPYWINNGGEGDNRLKLFTKDTKPLWFHVVSFVFS